MPQNEIRSILLKAIRPPLEASGFDKFARDCSFRQLEDRIDVVELRMAKPGKNAPYRMPPNSFEIEAGVFFKFAPHPMGATFKGVDNLAIENASDAHVRISSSPRLLLRDSWKSSFWRVDIWAVRKKCVLSDVKSNIQSYLLPWFDKFSDLSAVRRHILNVFESGGRLQIAERTPESWGRVYGFKILPAFFALHLEDWNEAKTRLTALLAEPHPGHENEPKRFPAKLYHSMEPMLLESLAEAEAHLQDM